MIGKIPRPPKTVIFAGIGLLLFSTGVFAVIEFFFHERLRYETGKTPIDIHLTDLTGDKIPDLITANRNDDSLTIFIGSGDGSFYDPAHLDLKTIQTWLPSTSERSPSAARRETGVGPISINSGDFNRDQLMDLVITRCRNFCTQGSFMLLFGDGKGNFKKGPSISAGQAPYNVLAGDFNDDGWLDMAASDYPSKKLFVVMSNGDGGYRAPASLGTGKKPISLRAADINEDGRLDLISSDHTEHSASIFISTGTGSFLPRREYPLGKLPYSITTGDFNGDGRPDLAVGHSDTPGGISIHLNQGNATFQEFERFGADDPIIFVEAADFDGDGKLDLVATNSNAKYALVYLGKGDGTFDIDGIRIPSEDQIYALSVGDLNDDGIKDIASIDYKQAKMFIAIGKEKSSY